MQPRRPAPSCAPGSKPQPPRVGQFYPSVAVFFAHMTQPTNHQHQPTTSTNQPPTTSTNQQQNLALFFRWKKTPPATVGDYMVWFLPIPLLAKKMSSLPKNSGWNKTQHVIIYHHDSGIKTPQSILRKWTTHHISPQPRFQISLQKTMRI